MKPGGRSVNRVLSRSARKRGTELLEAAVGTLQQLGRNFHHGQAGFGRDAFIADRQPACAGGTRSPGRCGRWSRTGRPPGTGSAKYQGFSRATHHFGGEAIRPPKQSCTGSPQLVPANGSYPARVRFLGRTGMVGGPASRPGSLVPGHKSGPAPKRAVVGPDGAGTVAQCISHSRPRWPQSLEAIAPVVGCFCGSLFVWLVVRWVNRCAGDSHKF